MYIKSRYLRNQSSHRREHVVSLLSSCLAADVLAVARRVGLLSLSVVAVLVSCLHHQWSALNRKVLQKLRRLSNPLSVSITIGVCVPACN